MDVIISIYLLKCDHYENNVCNGCREVERRQRSEQLRRETDRILQRQQNEVRKRKEAMEKRDAERTKRMELEKKQRAEINAQKRRQVRRKRQVQHSVQFNLFKYRGVLEGQVYIGKRLVQHVYYHAAVCGEDVGLDACFRGETTNGKCKFNQV